MVTACVRIFVYTYMYIYSCTGESRTHYNVSKCMYVCMCKKSISFTDRVFFGYCLFNRWQNAAFHITPFFLLKLLYMCDEKRRWWLEDHDGKWAMMYVCTHTSLAFVFRLRCACLSPSLSLFFVFQKTACAQAHHMCYRRAHPFFFFSLLCLTCSIITNTACRCMCTSKEDEYREGERENERRKDWVVLNVYNEEEEKNVAPYVVFLSCYRIRENEDVKKDVFSFFFVLSIRAHHHRIHIHIDIYHKSLWSFR